MLTEEEELARRVDLVLNEERSLNHRFSPSSSSSSDRFHAAKGGSYEAICKRYLDQVRKHGV